MGEKLNYRDSGVNLEEADASVETIKKMVRDTYRPEVMQDIGGFGGLFAFNHQRYRHPVLVSGADGVGTKLKLAFAMNKHDTVGEDCVAMCVNDLLVQGAEPLFFLDYLALEKMEKDRVEEIIRGITSGCQKAGCSLLGGETAEMPGFYKPEEYDLAGFAVGVVEKDRLIDGTSIEAGDRILGLSSNGVHSNGFSLVRRILEINRISLQEIPEELGISLGEELLKPTRIYVKPVLSLLEKYRVKGMAHITGGGIPGNLTRVLPSGLKAKLLKECWEVPPVFSYLKKKGSVEDREMYRVFNMGLGFMLVVPKEEADSSIKHLEDFSINARIVGEIERGKTGESAEVDMK